MADPTRRRATCEDPVMRTLEAYELEGVGYRLLGTWRDAAVVRVAPFDAIELGLAALWG